MIGFSAGRLRTVADCPAAMFGHMRTGGKVPGSCQRVHGNFEEGFAYHPLRSKKKTSCRAMCLI
ncbi:MAG: hypothetical protein CM15mP92_2330 [Halieaceae bacterium]|nr:MAG: hypothetical protein CM15mP92_2330 [Halieaceae bacterium]